MDTDLPGGAPGPGGACPHCFDNNTSPEVIWTVPSENSKVEWNWYFKYFYHYSSYEYFGIET
ncbi:hypothetical protein NE555_16615, partial [Alistipes onderdonkii]|uniref:hypothetical protein n=1 Tax=Alistipes onderdonkii TaxID=328813 RepID=UPI00210BBA27